MTQRNVHYRIAALLVAAVWVPASFASGQEQADKVEFSHPLHVEDEEMSCDECHKPSPGSEMPILLESTCGDCHDVPDWIRPEPSGGLPKGFSHTRHATGRDCKECHEKSVAKAGWRDKPLVARSKCVSCHASNQVLVEFPHPLHVEEEEMDCDECHTIAAGAAKPVLAEGTCGDCHKKPNWVRPSPLAWPPVAFQHDKHSGDVECAECHTRTVTAVGWQSKPLVAQEQCAECHGAKGVEVAEVACRSCHGVDMKTALPPDHKASWRALHGKQARWRVFEQHGAECSTCHTNDACVSCHSSERPRSHTSLWRFRGHGITASWNRESCKTCHETGTCTQCHKTTPPLNHAGAWSSTHGLAAQVKGNDTCATCHSRSECFACHSGAAR